MAGTIVYFLTDAGRLKSSCRLPLEPMLGVDGRKFVYKAYPGIDNCAGTLASLWALGITSVSRIKSGSSLQIDITKTSRLLMN